MTVIEWVYYKENLPNYKENLLLYMKNLLLYMKILPNYIKNRKIVRIFRKVDIMEIIKSGVKKREILKSNRLIEGSYKFTTSENRLVDLALMKLEVIMLDKNLSAEEVAALIKKAQFEEITIYVSDYKKEYNIKNNTVYEELAKSANRLLKRQLVYSEKGRLIKKNWAITCIFNDDENSISIQFHPDLIADLLMFKGCYTRFDFDVRKYIKSFYTCRIYELLKQYETYGTRTFTLEKLRFLLGIDDNEYPLWSNIRQSVILPAVEGINKKLDLYVEWESSGAKRKVENVSFKFRKQKSKIENRDQIGLFNQKSSIPEDIDYNIIAEFKELLGVTIGVHQIDKFMKDSAKAIKQYDLNISVKEYIAQKKIVVDNYAEKHNVPSYIGAMVRAVQENWVLNFKSQAKGAFNNYEQRTYDGSDGKMDFRQLEKKLLGWDKSADDEVASTLSEEE